MRSYNLSIENKKSVLAGIKVLEVGDELGEWCGKLLADMGAEVIKIEPVTGFDIVQGNNGVVHIRHFNIQQSIRGKFPAQIA